MKNFLIFITFVIFTCKPFLSESNIYKSDFYNINISNELISDAKTREINKIKNLSFLNILERILLKDEIKKLNRIININKNINYLIKNIIIEDEFISENNYSSQIKINFDKTEIIKILRNNKIDYTDLESKNLLLISSVSNKLYEEGLNEDNIFYKSNNKNKYGLLNIINPELSINDRFILPYNKIINLNLKALKDIAIKYDTLYVIILNITELDSKFLVNSYFFSSELNSIENINTITINQNKDYVNELFSNLNIWWKNKHIINNNMINTIKCNIVSQSIDELKYINEKINFISQVKSNKLINIKLGSNINDILFYGNLSNFILKLKSNSIYLKINSNSECIISLTK